MRLLLLLKSQIGLFGPSPFSSAGSPSHGRGAPPRSSPGRPTSDQQPSLFAGQLPAPPTPAAETTTATASEPAAPFVAPADSDGASTTTTTASGRTLADLMPAHAVEDRQASLQHARAVLSRSGATAAELDAALRHLPANGKKADELRPQLQRRLDAAGGPVPHDTPLPAGHPQADANAPAPTPQPARTDPTPAPDLPPVLEDVPAPAPVPEPGRLAPPPSHPAKPAPRGERPPDQEPYQMSHAAYLRHRGADGRITTKKGKADWHGAHFSHSWLVKHAKDAGKVVAPEILRRASEEPHPSTVGKRPPRYSVKTPGTNLRWSNLDEWNDVHDKTADRGADQVAAHLEALYHNPRLLDGATPEQIGRARNAIDKAVLAGETFDNTSLATARSKGLHDLLDTAERGEDMNPAIPPLAPHEENARPIPGVPDARVILKDRKRFSDIEQEPHYWLPDGQGTREAKDLPADHPALPINRAAAIFGKDGLWQRAHVEPVEAGETHAYTDDGDLDTFEQNNYGHLQRTIGQEGIDKLRAAGLAVRFPSAGMRASVLADWMHPGVEVGTQPLNWAQLLNGDEDPAAFVTRHQWGSRTHWRLSHPGRDSSRSFDTKGEAMHAAREMIENHKPGGLWERHALADHPKARNDFDRVLMARALGMERGAQVQAAPPGAGWEPVPRSRKGGWRRKLPSRGAAGRNYQYWYPGTGVVERPHAEDEPTDAELPPPPPTQKPTPIANPTPPQLARLAEISDGHAALTPLSREHDQALANLGLIEVDPSLPPGHPRRTLAADYLTGRPVPENLLPLMPSLLRPTAAGLERLDDPRPGHEPAPEPSDDTDADTDTDAAPDLADTDHDTDDEDPEEAEAPAPGQLPPPPGAAKKTRASGGSRGKGGDPSKEGRLEHGDWGEYVAGDRKEQFRSVHAGNLAAVEAEGEIAAHKLVSKDRVLSKPDVALERSRGATAGAVYLKKQLLQHVAARPDASPAARQVYVEGAAFLQKALDGCRTVQDITSLMSRLRAATRGDDLSDQMTGAELVRFLGLDPATIQPLAQVSYYGWTRIDLLGEGGDGTHALPREAIRAAGYEDLIPASSTYGRPTLYQLSRKNPDGTAGLTRIVQALGGGKPAHRFAWEDRKTRFYRAISQDGAFRGQVHEAQEIERKGDWSKVDEGAAAVAAHPGKPKKTKQRRSLEELRLREALRVGGTPLPAEQLTEENLGKGFNLRAVRYGTGGWVSDKGAQAHLRNAYGALADLADVLGVEPRQLSHGGRLALAFGARGNGQAGAHYEQDRQIINLTHTQGAGSLAHEWGHFLDHMLTDTTDAAGGIQVVIDGNKARGHLLSEGEGAPSVPPEVATAMRGVMDAIKVRPSKALPFTAEQMAAHQARAERIAAAHTLNRQRKLSSEEIRAINAEIPEHRAMSQQIAAARAGKTDFLRHAEALGSYWASHHEMFARCFEAFVEDELQARDRRNTYLVSGTSVPQNWLATQTRGHASAEVEAEPYPHGEERQRISAAMRAFVAAVTRTGALRKALAQLAE